VHAVADEVSLGGERSDDAEGARLDGVFKDPGNDRLCFDTVKRAAGLPALRTCASRLSGRGLPRSHAHLFGEFQAGQRRES
jgi:hypothetical protein